MMYTNAADNAISVSFLSNDFHDSREAKDIKGMKKSSNVHTAPVRNKGEFKARVGFQEALNVKISVIVYEVENSLVVS